MIELAVVRFREGWKILAGGVWRGRFDYEVDAVDAALRLADRSGFEGQPAAVLVQGRFGEMRRAAHPTG